MDFFPNSPDAMDFSDEDGLDGAQANFQPSAATSTALLTSLGLGHHIQFFRSTGKVYNVGQTFLDCFGWIPIQFILSQK